MGLFSDLFKQTIPPETWARFALDQLFSEKWFDLRNSFRHLAASHEQSLSSIREQDFLDELLAAQLVLLRLVAGIVHAEVFGQVVLLTATEYLPRLGRESENRIELWSRSYDYNRKLAEGLARGEEFAAIGDVFVDRLGCNVSPEFRQQVRTDFSALGKIWEKDAAQYRFR